MFYNKRIKALEETLNEAQARVEALEQRVEKLAKEVVDLVIETDTLWRLYNEKREATPATPASKPKPRYRARKKNGKETPKSE
jgi:regulator of replication initiation timing